MAFIGAGGMGAPLAAYAKRLGKIGFLVGEHLQLLLRVKGTRRKNDSFWRGTMFNEWRIDMPERDRPKPGDRTGDY